MNLNENILGDLRKFLYYSIKGIENPSLQEQQFSVMEMSDSIKYIKSPYPEIQLLAVHDDPFNIKHIKNPTEEAKLLAIKNNPHTIRYIKNPSLELQMKAVSRDFERGVRKTLGYVINKIANPYPEVVELHESLILIQELKK